MRVRTKAGHLAVMPGALRESMDDYLAGGPSAAWAGEAKTTAAAWAALVLLRLDPAVQFRDSGHHGQAPNLITTSAFGVAAGCHGLVQADPAAPPGTPAAASFPVLRCCLRE